MKKNIREVIINAIMTDDSWNDKNLKNIEETYLKAPDMVKNQIDNIFQNLCGYSLNTIIMESKNKSDAESITVNKIELEVNKISEATFRN